MNKRSLVIDGLINPAVMNGLQVVAGQVDMTDTKTCTITFPSKSIVAVFGTIGVAVAAHTASVTNGLATVVFTAAATGMLNYIVVASGTETVTSTSGAGADIVISAKQ